MLPTFQERQQSQYSSVDTTTYKNVRGEKIHLKKPKNAANLSDGFRIRREKRRHLKYL